MTDGDGRVRRATAENVADLVGKGYSDDRILEELGCSRTTLNNRKRAAGLIRSKAPAQSRIPTKKVDKGATMPAVTHPALAAKRTIYPTTVTDDPPRILVEGKNHWKIGNEIVKGRWAGFPIFTLTLEERATCPTYCHHWRSCYGNHMHLARRVVGGAAMEARLHAELSALQRRFPDGFAVRLHILGDFYSVEYVRSWARWLDEFPALRVFGFTSRWDARVDPIAADLQRLILKRWDRFAVRFSNSIRITKATVSIEHPVQKPDDAVICPQQEGKTPNCGTCAMCWETERRVAFLQH